MKRLYSLMPLLLLSIATAFSVSCEKPEPEPPAPPVEEPEITTAERLVGKWVLDGFYAKSRDTLLFLENGICLRIIKESPSDTISYYFITNVPTSFSSFMIIFHKTVLNLIMSSFTTIITTLLWLITHSL